MFADESRYHIYWLLQRDVDVKAHTGRRIAGKVERVYRDVMDGKVDFTLNGRRVSFTEPDVILKEGEDVVFVYGSVHPREETDEEVFHEATLASQAGESFDDMLHRTTPSLRKETRFMVKSSLPVPV